MCLGCYPAACVLLVLKEAIGSFVAGEIPPWGGFLTGRAFWLVPLACICKRSVCRDIPNKTDAVDEGLAFFSVGTPSLASYRIDLGCEQGEMYLEAVQCFAPIDALVP